MRNTSVRRALLVVVALLTLAALPAVASAGVSTGDGVWVWQNPLPQGNVLSAGWFADADNGWFVGHNGTIMHTADGGASWDGQTSPTPVHLNSVCFPDALHGWAVGNWFSGLIWTTDYPKAIITTSDGGRTWRTQETGMIGIQNQGNTTLNCVRFADATHGWAVGVYWHDMAPRALILATTDGGAHWVQQGPASVGFELKAITCTDSLHAWAVGTNGDRTGSIVLATHDGGVTWDLQDAGLAAEAYDVQFLDTHIGWVVGMWGEIAATTDGGTTWTAGSVGTNTILSDVLFTDRMHGMAIGENKLYRTSDGGTSWEMSTPLPVESPATALVPAGGKVWLIGTVYREFAPYDCVLLCTSDGGETWTTPSSGETTDLSDICFVSRTKGFAAGAGGVLLGTGNAGETWSRIDSGSREDLQDVVFVDAQNGWLVGGSALLRTVDGGLTWQPRIAPLSGLRRACFVDALHGWVLADGNSLMRTDDGGSTWRTASLTQVDILNGISFLDERHGWAAGELRSPAGPERIWYGVLLRTDDGGAHWRVQYHSDFPLKDVQFTDAAHGWYVDGTQEVSRTTDGGDSWSSCDSNVWNNLWSGLTRLDMLDAHHGWAVGTNGGILATTDGEHWVMEQSGTRRTLKGISFVDPGNGWVAGEGGIILKDPGPICRAYRSVGRRGATATLRYKVSDAAVVRLTVTIRIRNSHGHGVQKLVLRHRPANTVLSVRFRCLLARGRYTFFVYATDSAGMKAAAPAMSKLTVK